MEALLGIAHESSKNSLEHSFQLECHKFSIRALMKPENRARAPVGSVRGGFLYNLVPHGSYFTSKNRIRFEFEAIRKIRSEPSHVTY